MEDRFRVALIQLPIRARVALILSIAENVLGVLRKDKEGFSLAQEALHLAWLWQYKCDIPGNTLAQYVDSPTSKDLGVREILYKGDTVMISAVIVITMAIAYTSRLAYLQEGLNNMPCPINEADDVLILKIISHAKKLTVLMSKKQSEY